MKFNKQHDIAATTAKNGGRYAAEGVYVGTRNGIPYLASTDSHCMTTIPCVMEDDDHSAPMIVSTTAIKQSRKLAGRDSQAQIRLNGAATTKDGATTQYVMGDFPDAQRIFPTSAPSKYVDLSISAELLHKVATVLGESRSDVGETVTMRIGVVELDGKLKCDGNAIMVTRSQDDVPSDPRGAVGVMPIGLIMPITEN